MASAALTAQAADLRSRLEATERAKASAAELVERHTRQRAEARQRFAPLADVIVASEENIPGTGYAYDTFFGSLAFNPNLVGAEALASGFVTNYENEYRGNAEGADTLSAFRSSGLAGLTSALQAFTTAALAGGVTTAKFDVLTGVQVKAASNAPSYTKVFAQSLVAEAERDEKIVAVTAAMPDGNGSCS